MAVTVNAGSSSLRLAVYQLGDTPHRIAHEHIAHVPRIDPCVLTTLLADAGGGAPAAVVHRIVHGGSTLTKPCLIGIEVEAEIDRLASMAPLHNNIALDWVRAARIAFGEATPQVAVFDTAFYAALPASAVYYALPQDICRTHAIRRYGFHGLAHESMRARWREFTGASGRSEEDTRVISLQLGAGSSVTATRGPYPMETSMGFSPLEGLIMATRSGDLDPAVVLHLIDQGWSTHELRDLLSHHSGLAGIAGAPADMASLLQREDEDAKLAVDMFCQRARKYLGAYIAVLGGVDAVLFGGGIGEHSAPIRDRIMTGLDWLGLRLDPDRNAAVDPYAGGAVHAEDSRATIWVTPVDEARAMLDAAPQALPL